jgi:hypothetical protein
MKKLLVGFALVIVLAMSVVHLHAQQGVGGTWSLDAHGMSMTMVLVQDGEKISGTIDTPHGVIQLKGDFSKGTLTLIGTGTPEHPVDVTGTATLGKDGSLTGTLTANLMEITFTAARTSNATLPSKDEIRSWHDHLLKHIFG